MYWGVDGVALCEVADGGVVRVDVGQIAAAVEECLRVAFCPCGLLTLLHVLRHLRERREIAVNQLCRLRPAYVQTFGESEDRYAVDDAEVGTFGFGSLVACHVGNVFLVYLRGCRGVYVVPEAERFCHVLVSAEMRHDAQFYLRIVGGEEQAAFLRDEAAAYLLAILPADGNVLQVGVA